jgi:ferritin-like metal-binding protein YciE
MAKSGKTLRDLFHDTLKDIYFAEKKILTTLPKMAKVARSEDLRAAFDKHHRETEGHVERLEEVFQLLEKKPQGKTCDAIVGITEEGAEIIKEYKGTPALDAGPPGGGKRPLIIQRKNSEAAPRQSGSSVERLPPAS